MARYRIVKLINEEGEVKYEMQKKFPIFNVWCHTNYKLYDTIDEVKEACNIDQIQDILNTVNVFMNNGITFGYNHKFRYYNHE